MKLLFVVNVDWFFVSHRLPIALKAIKSGYEVHLATTITDKKDILEAHGIILHPIEVDRSGAGPLGFFKLLLSIYLILKKVQPTVTHFVTIKPVLIGGIAARLIGLQRVVYAISGLGHVFITKTFVGKIRRELVSYLYRFILGVQEMRIIFQNPDDRKLIEKIADIDPAKVVMIPGSGVALSEFNYARLPQPPFTILMAARLLKTKGVNEFVEAARIVKSKYHDVRFLLVGAPDLENPASVSYEDLASWKEEGVVEILGHRSDISALMQKAHIVTLPSYYGEGLPKVLIEAAACGRAVITTDMPGCRDAIEDGVTGTLIPPQDSQALADAIISMLKSPDLCHKLGEAGRARAEKIFDIDAVVSTHLNIYKELVNK